MKLALAVIITLALASCICAQGYKIDWYSVNSGGGTISSSSYRTIATVGQPAAGFSQGSSFLHWTGFWSGELPTPTVAATPGAAKLLPDGTFVSLAGKMATSGAGDFQSFFYVEEQYRSSGIRVAAPPLPELSRSSVVNVIGTLGTTPDGERQVTGPIVIITGSQTPLTPLGMSNISLGGSNLSEPLEGLGQFGVTGGNGLNNIGLLVKTWGLVVSADTGYVMLDDGSGPVRVDTSVLASQPTEGTFVSVIGISSLHNSSGDRLRLVLPRSSGDVSRHH